MYRLQKQSDPYAYSASALLFVAINSGGKNKSVSLITYLTYGLSEYTWLMKESMNLYLISGINKININ